MWILIISVCVVLASGKPHVKVHVDSKNLKCGTPTIGPKAGSAGTYIVGGTEANPGAWPWQISLQSRGSHFCGGTLVRNNNGRLVVVTAAHCVEGSLSLSRLSVKVGVHRLSSSQGQTIGISEIRMHANYNSATINNDIAILMLSSDPVENDDVMPACLPSGDHGVNEISYVTGWGTTSEGGRIQDRLQEVSKPVLSDSACTGYLGSNYKSGSMLCAGFDQGGADACQGDSGGPLVSERNGVWELVGVVSWGFGCARPELPGVYADVWNFRNWIASNWSY